MVMSLFNWPACPSATLDYQALLFSRRLMALCKTHQGLLKNPNLSTALKLYPVLEELGLAPMADADLTKVRPHLSLCGAHTLGNLLRRGTGLSIMNKLIAPWANALVKAPRAESIRQINGMDIRILRGGLRR